MTDETETTELTVDARIRRTEEVEPCNGFLWKFVGEVVAFFPSYRDSRDGRKKQKQMQIGLIVIGLALLALGGTADEWGGLWILLGILIACFAFVVPVEELKKRSWRSSIAKKQNPRPTYRRDDGRVEFDGEALAVYTGDHRVRRIRTARGKHDLALRQKESGPCLGILPPGAKKRDSIWLCASGPVDAPLEFDGSIADDDMDRPAIVDPRDWEKLWEALHQTN